MLKESGRVVAIEDDALWVETISRSTCGSCQARAGCGQGVLSRWMSRASHIRVLVNREQFDREIHVDDQVDIGIGETVVVSGSLFVYLLPLVFLLMGAYLGAHVDDMASIVSSSSEVFSILGGLIGLVAGGFAVRFHAHKTRSNPDIQPILLGHYPKFSENHIASSC